MRRFRDRDILILGFYFTGLMGMILAFITGKPIYYILSGSLAKSRDS